MKDYEIEQELISMRDILVTMHNGHELDVTSPESQPYIQNLILLDIALSLRGVHVAVVAKT